MKKRILGDIIIILIGTFPFIDNILSSLNIIDINFGNNFGFNTGYNFLWTVLTALTPILFTIAFKLRPHLLFFAFPVFSYSCDLFWIFGDKRDSFDYSYVYGALTGISFIVISFLLNRYIKEEKTKDEKISFLEKMLDLSYTLIKKQDER